MLELPKHVLINYIFKLNNCVSLLRDVYKDVTAIVAVFVNLLLEIITK